MVNRNQSRARLKVSADGRGVVGHAGARLLADLADRVGLTSGLSTAMAPTKQRRRGHDRGQVLVDLAVMIADGGTTISDLAVLRDQPSLFGDVASTPTAWRTLDAVDNPALERIATARSRARSNVWAAGADPGFYVIDFDATLITSHSDKHGAAATYKKGFGFHPLLAFLDATGEALAGLLRAGNARIEHRGRSCRRARHGVGSTPNRPDVGGGDRPRRLGWFDARIHQRVRRRERRV